MTYLGTSIPSEATRPTDVVAILALGYRLSSFGGDA